MIVFVNNQTKEIANQENISGLLTSISYVNQKGIAIAVNDQVVPKTEWQERLLSENDRITIIRASQGG